MDENILTRKEKERNFRKSVILDASVSLFCQRGFISTTLDDIAARAEFGKGTLYNYFKSKEDIYSVIINNVSNELNYIAKSSDESSSSTEEFICKYTTDLFSYCLNHKEEYVIFVREIVHFTTDKFVLNREEIIERHDSTKKILMKRFSDGVNRKELKIYQPEKLISLFENFIFPYILYLCGLPSDVLDEKKEIDFLLNVFFNGVLIKNS